MGEVLGGDFEIVRRLSGGGMGAVYLAHQRSTDALRAVKIMLPHWLEHPELVRRFEQEAKACGRIHSEHVVKVLHYGIDEERRMPWLVMEYLPGQTLDRWVARRGPMSRDELLRVLEELFHGVGAAHRAGVVHRDLKPPNLYVAESQRAGVPFTLKILDFGIAKMLRSSRPVTLAMGTKAWMAPEQERVGAVITEAADLWAVGLIVFWLLTGRSFWVNADAADSSLSFEIFFAEIPSASARARQLGAPGAWGSSLDTWFAQCLQRDPNERFPSAESCWQPLRTALESVDWAEREAAFQSSRERTAPDTHADESLPSSSSERLDIDGSAPTQYVASELLSSAGPRTTTPTVDRTSPPPVVPARVRTRRVFRWLGACVLGAGLVASGVRIAVGVRGPLVPAVARLSGLGDTIFSQDLEASKGAPWSVMPFGMGRHAEDRDMVWVSPGSFVMGYEDKKRRHQLHPVVLTRGFLIDRFEVTVADYAQCVDQGRCTPNGLHGPSVDAREQERYQAFCNLPSDESRQNHPINCVDWQQATDYCAFRGKRLPTEAEWEYSARGGDGRRFPWGDAPPRSCRFTVAAGLCGVIDGTREVGTRTPESRSPFGAMDLSGNVWEWVQDSWHGGDRNRTEETDPVLPSDAPRKILRGGSFEYAPNRGSVAYRLPFDRRIGHIGTGFRCAKDADGL